MVGAEFLEKIVELRLKRLFLKHGLFWNHAITECQRLQTGSWLISIAILPVHWNMRTRLVLDESCRLNPNSFVVLILLMPLQSCSQRMQFFVDVFMLKCTYLKIVHLETDDDENEFLDQIAAALKQRKLN